MKKIFLSIILALALISACISETDIAQISGKELEAIQNDETRRQNYLLIDVRTTKEFAEGHLKYAINIPLDELEKHENLYSDFKNKNTIVVMCRSGRRSMIAAKKLVSMGYKNVYNAPGVTRYNYKSVVR